MRLLRFARNDTLKSFSATCQDNVSTLSPRRSLEAKRPDKKGIVGMGDLVETMHLEVAGVGAKRIAPAG